MDPPNVPPTPSWVMSLPPPDNYYYSVPMASDPERINEPMDSAEQEEPMDLTTNCTKGLRPQHVFKCIYPLDLKVQT
ncbi:unnamed protein product [Larinioides sclopetarius]|uniref:Uncharacterized protein n=1 Tax=Larinioides sclopetarius TaxID=280406 RepID=A0AAV2ASM3_9ARAC